MGIQVVNSLHAAASYFVQQPEPITEPDVFVRSQSTNGLLLSRIVVDPLDPDLVIFHILLDYPLDPGSCAFSCQPFAALDPLTADGFFNPFVPLLIHIDEKEKVLLLVNDLFEPAETLDTQFHIEFTNFQSNLRENLPVLDFVFPTP